MPEICVIFDLDGTLVDSEGLCNQAFLDLLPDLTSSLEELTDSFRGKKLEVILTNLSRRLNRPLAKTFEADYRKRVTELFKTQLRPTPGTSKMLIDFPYTKCVASSGPLEKITQALSVTGLLSSFGENLYSSYEIQSWKPDPELFLHAAKQMGFPPSQCVVVEDSDVGIKAAIAAGMRAVYYNPQLDVAPQKGLTQLSNMSLLPEIIKNLEIQ